MNKTPVTILQEMMVKKLTVPTYELIHDGGGTHINTFTYQVTCDDLRATGTGRSKKEAKHEAAKAMLETIAAHRGYPQLPASPAPSPVRTPLPPTVPELPKISPNIPFVNAIGALQDLCAENNLQEPRYTYVSDVGPPHAKIFTIQCSVSAFNETGVAKTKKQAKHVAAKKMLEKLSDLVADQINKYSIDTEFEDTNNFAMECYTLLKNRRVMLGVDIQDYHKRLKNSVDDEVCNKLLVSLKSIIPKDYSSNSEEFIDELFSKFCDCILTLNLHVSTMTLESAIPNNHIVLMTIDSFPAITQISCGITNTEAKFCTLKNLIDTMIFLLE